MTALFLATLLSILAWLASPFANHMLRDYCDTPLIEGTFIMGSGVRRDLSGLYSIRVFSSDGEELISDHIYKGCDMVVTVAVEPKVYQCVLEVEGGSFIKGGCNGGVRSHPCSNATLSLAADEGSASGKVTIKAAYAKGYSSGVYLVTKDFNLLVKAIGTDDSDGSSSVLQSDL